MIAEEEEAHRLFLEEEYYYCSDEYEIPTGEIKPTFSSLDYLLIQGPHGIELECRFDEFDNHHFETNLICSSNSDFINSYKKPGSDFELYGNVYEDEITLYTYRYDHYYDCYDKECLSTLRC
jgi:hypothetical protein